MSCLFFLVLFIPYITLAPSCDVASPQRTAEYVASDDTLTTLIKKQKHQEESFYVYDLRNVEESMSIWENEMPNIAPYYAVKCNPNPILIQKLASLGANFDCASPHEIDLVIQQGISPSRILYANPCKRCCDIEYAYAKGVTMTTFDSVCELQKIANVAPKMSVMLRLYANDPTAQCVLSNKFGAKQADWDQLLDAARSLQLDLFGISFHVGSGASSPEAFHHAIAQARALYDTAQVYGYTPNIIDLGGGFSRKTITKMAREIQRALATQFPFNCKIIAEPGRFFAETCATLYTRVIGLRESPSTSEMFCTITDGVYGSFNNIVYDHAQVPYPVMLNANGDKKHGDMIHTTVFGPTCDGFDTLTTCMLPKVSLGDFLVFRDMGAYTIAGACNFNGIQFMTPKCLYLM